MDRLDEIEARLKAAERYPAAMPFDREDVAWLVAEVRKLTVALNASEEDVGTARKAYCEARALALSLAEALEHAKLTATTRDNQAVYIAAISDQRLLKLKGGA